MRDSEGKAEPLSNHARILDAMADEYSIRARAARAAQGLPETVQDRGVLNQVSMWMAEDVTSAPREQQQSVA